MPGTEMPIPSHEVPCHTSICPAANGFLVGAELKAEFKFVHWHIAVGAFNLMNST